MSFASVLSEYIVALGCTNRELSQCCGISISALSRYRNGSRMPNPDSSALARLAEGIAQLASEHGIAEASDAAMVYVRLMNTLPEEDNSISFSRKLSQLMSVMHISNNELAHYANVDPSYISRIRNGNRKPTDRKELARRCADYASRHLASDDDRTAIKVLLRNPAWGQPTDLDNFNDLDAVSMTLSGWLLDENVFEEQAPEDSPHFLQAIDEFDFNEYVKNEHFDTMKLPDTPVVFPMAKRYEGIEGMREAEVSFFRTAALSSETKEVFICTDIPMESLAEDTDFARKWMLGLAAIINHGAHITIVHDLNRPVHEMMRWAFRPGFRSI